MEEQKENYTHFARFWWKRNFVSLFSIFFIKETNIDNFYLKRFLIVSALSPKVNIICDGKYRYNEVSIPQGRLSILSIHTKMIKTRQNRKTQEKFERYPKKFKRMFLELFFRFLSDFGDYFVKNPEKFNISNVWIFTLWARRIVTYLSVIFQPTISW